MLYATPTITDLDDAVLAAIDDLRDRLRYFLSQPRRWYGTLRRATFARAIQGSNSIEGYNASVSDVAAVIEGEEPLDADTETAAAIAGCRDAMTFVLQLAASAPMPPLDGSLLNSLHFMMLKYDLTKNPGQWRPGAVWVDDEDGNTVYDAPPRNQIDDLMAEMLGWLAGDASVPLIRAAMAHLNLVLIHPYSDGNGRMARCVQSYVLAADRGRLAPEFLSIEEYLGRNTRAYYQALTDVAHGQWRPETDARPWIELCLTAHYRQALTILRRIDETEALWDRCEQLVRRHGLPERCVGPLCDAARGWPVRRSLYIKNVLSSSGETISEAAATRDLRALADAGLLDAEGERRGRRYRAGGQLRAIWADLRDQRRPRGPDDPYAVARDRTQPTLPGLGTRPA